jgi:hypothetical protein
MDKTNLSSEALKKQRDRFRVEIRKKINDLSFGSTRKRNMFLNATVPNHFLNKKIDQTTV